MTAGLSLNEVVVNRGVVGILGAWILCWLPLAI